MKLLQFEHPAQHVHNYVIIIGNIGTHLHTPGTLSINRGYLGLGECCWAEMVKLDLDLIVTIRIVSLGNHALFT